MESYSKSTISFFENLNVSKVQIKSIRLTANLAVLLLQRVKEYIDVVFFNLTFFNWNSRFVNIIKNTK
jgi:hypothetical protein